MARLSGIRSQTTADTVTIFHPATSSPRTGACDGRSTQSFVSSLTDPLTLYGAVAVSAMMVCYALERRSSLFVLAFAAACIASAIYGFLQGAWPFGVVELVWAGVALRRWRRRAGRAVG